MTITLSDAEVAALQTECTSPDDTPEAVLHRLIAPLVNRVLAAQAAAFIDQFNKIPDTDTKASVLAQVQAIADTVRTAGGIKTPPDKRA